MKKILLITSILTTAFLFGFHLAAQNVGNSSKDEKVLVVNSVMKKNHINSPIVSFAQQTSTELKIPLVNPPVVISSYYNDANPSNEWTELLVVADNVDIRGWSIQDNNNAQNSWQGPPYLFKSVPLWNNLRSGTIIMIWSHGTHTTQTNKVDGYIEVTADDAVYFTRGGGTVLNIGSTGDIIRLLDASQTYVHAVGHSALAGPAFNACPSPKLNYQGGLNNGSVVCVSPGPDLDHYGNVPASTPQDGNTWTSIETGVDITFGLPNKQNPNNLTYPASANSDFWRSLRQPIWTTPNLMGTVDITNSNVILNWNAANDIFPSDGTQGYIILRNTVNAFGTPIDGHTYIVGDNVTNGGTIIADINSSQTLTYTDNSTTPVPSIDGYYYEIFAYRYSTDNVFGNNYNIARGRAYNETSFGYTHVTFPALPALCGNYTIGGANPDFHTFNDAVLALTSAGISCPVVFKVRNGTYNEQIEMLPFPGSSSVNTVTFESESGDSSSVIITSNYDISSQPHTILLNGVKHIRFNKISFGKTGTYWDYYAMMIGSNSSDIQIQNCNISPNLANGIYIKDQADLITIKNSYFNGSGTAIYNGNLAGVRLNTSGYVKIIDNTITSFQSSGIAGSAGKLIIEKNNLNQFSVYDWTTDAAINCNVSDTCSIRFNTISKSYDGIVANGSGRYLINGNAIDFRIGTGINSNIINSTISNNWIHNTESNLNSQLVFNSIDIKGFDNTSKSMLISNNQNLVIKNNIFNNLAGGYCINLNGTNTNLIWDYNDYNSSANIIGYINGTTYSSFASWSSAINGETNGKNLNPYFTNDSSYHVNQCGLNGAGIPIPGILYDIDGQIRNSQTPDIGAWEFNCGPIKWSGLVNTEWNKPGNWVENVVPLTTDDVIIPAGCQYYPIVTNPVTCKNATIQAGGMVTINSSPPFRCGQSLIDDRDGKTYNTVLIGTQCWMAQNLNIGTKIAGLNDQANNGIIEKYCYDDDENNCNTYGGLYQWNEAMQYSTIEGVKGICPTGWYLPTDAEWTTLTTYLGGESVAGGKMKEAGTSHWSPPNTGATNSSGFIALPGGYRNVSGSLVYYREYAHFWSSSQIDSTNVWLRGLSCGWENASRTDNVKTIGLSVRCLKDN